MFDLKEANQKIQNLIEENEKLKELLKEKEVLADLQQICLYEQLFEIESSVIDCLLHDSKTKRADRLKLLEVECDEVDLTMKELNQLKMQLYEILRKPISSSIVSDLAQRKKYSRQLYERFVAH